MNPYKINTISRDEYGRPSGIVALNKPAGITSHDLVNQLRDLLGTKKVGHIGALDVFAEGVMIYLVGKATKLSEKLMHLDKEYVTTVILGVATDTQDTEGKITEIKTGFSLKDFPELEEIVASFKGKHQQYVSMYSSVKVKGKKLRVLMRDDNYEKAIKYDEEHNKILLLTPKEDSGLKPLEIAVPSKLITIHEIELIEAGEISVAEMKSFKEKLTNLPAKQKFPYLKLKIGSSKGTYIRQLAEDLGEKLGMPAMLLELTRTRVGEITLEETATIAEIASTRPPDKESAV